MDVRWRLLSLRELLRELRVMPRRAIWHRVGGREDLPDLAFTVARDGQKRPGELDRFRLRCRLQNREAPDQFLRLDERPVGHRHLSARTPDTRAKRARQA